MPTTPLTTYISNEGLTVLILICILVLWAFLGWMRTYFRLLQIEQGSLRNIQSAGKPTSIEAAHALLNRGNADSDVVAGLRAALELGELEESRLDFSGRIYWTRYLAGIFVFVGLLGTVWGIASAVASLGTSVTSISGSAANADADSSALTIQRWGKLLNGIENLLGGMRSAFYCTIAGILATLLVSFLNSCYLSTARHLEQQTHKLAEDWFLPLYRGGEINQQNELVQIKQTLERLEQQQSAVLPDWTQPLQGMMSAADALSSSADKLSSGSTAALQRLETLHTLSRELVANLEKSAQSLREESTNAAQRLYDANSLAVKQLRDESNQVQADLRDSDARLSAQQAALTKATQDIVEKYTKIAQKYDQISAHTTQLAEAAQTFPVYNTHLDGAAQAVRDAATRMETSVETLRRDLVLAQQQQHLSLNDVAANLTLSHKTLDALLRRFEITLADVSSNAAPPAVSQKEDLQQIRATLLTEMQRMQQSLNQVAQKVTEQTKVVTAAQVPRPTPSKAPEPAPVPAGRRPEPVAVTPPDPVGSPRYRSAPNPVDSTLQPVPAELPDAASSALETPLNSRNDVRDLSVEPFDGNAGGTPVSPSGEAIPRTDQVSVITPTEKRGWWLRLKGMFRKGE